MTSPKRHAEVRSWSVILTVLVTGGCVIRPLYVAAVDIHTDIWRAVINHRRIPDGENVVVTTKQGILQGRRIVGDNRAGRRIRVFTINDVRYFVVMYD